MNETSPIAIVPEPFDTETSDTPFGRRWGGQLVRLGPEHLAALRAGQTLALDAQGEYIVFVQLSCPEAAP